MRPPNRHASAHDGRALFADPAFRAAFGKFIAGARELRKQANWNDDLGWCPPTKVTRYLRVIEEMSNGQRPAWCFVDLTNGDVLKPQTYHQPAKHARGNIYDQTHGLSRITVHGPEYLR